MGENATTALDAPIPTTASFALRKTQATDPEPIWAPLDRIWQGGLQLGQLDISAIEHEAALARRHVGFAVPATERSVGKARATAISVLKSWNAPVDTDVAELLLSEVVTNAVLHGVCEERRDLSRVEVELVLTIDGLRVEVNDPDEGDGTGVTVGCPDADSENGHGLELVAALSACWGCSPTPTGKCVHFEIALTAPDVEGAGR